MASGRAVDVGKLKHAAVLQLRGDEAAGAHGLDDAEQMIQLSDMITYTGTYM